MLPGELFGNAAGFPSPGVAEPSPG
jgi:hypothetical protein